MDERAEKTYAQFTAKWRGVQPNWSFWFTLRPYCL